MFRSPQLARQRRPRLARRAVTTAFTLVEMVVVVVIIAILAAGAAVAYSYFIGGTYDARAKQQLREVGSAATVDAALNGVAEQVLRTSFQSGIQRFPDVAPTGVSAAGFGWRLLPATVAPTSDHDFSLAFDDGMGTPTSEVGGQRVAVVTRSGSGKFFAVLALAAPEGADAPATPFEVPPGASAADVLGGAVTPTSTLPYSSSTPATSTSSPTSTPAPTSATTTSATTTSATTTSATTTSATTTSATTTSATTTSATTTSATTTSATTTSATPSPTSTPAPTPTPTPTPTRNPAADPVTVTPAPQIDWTTCSGTVTSGARATVLDAKIATAGNSNVWWDIPSDAGVMGYKICAVSGSSYTLIASTGPGTATSRMWSIKTNQAHPNTFLAVITVFNDGHEASSPNSCEVRPAGAATGWPNQGRGC